jgi:hypothetical protein
MRLTSSPRKDSIVSKPWKRGSRGPKVDRHAIEEEEKEEEGGKEQISNLKNHQYQINQSQPMLGRDSNSELPARRHTS